MQRRLLEEIADDMIIFLRSDVEVGMQTIGILARSVVAGHITKKIQYK